MPPSTAKAPAKASPPKSTYCPNCFRPGEQSGTCGNFALGCPRPREADPRKSITVTCGPCKKTRIIPLENVMQRKRLHELGMCASDVCQAVVVPADGAA